MSDAFVIALANPKGGTGKSTLAIHLAVAAHRVGNQTLLVDTDEQRSVLDWHRWTADDFDGPDVDDVTSPKRLKAQTGVWADAYDVVVLDGAASVQGMTGALVNVADALVVLLVVAVVAAGAAFVFLDDSEPAPEPETATTFVTLDLGEQPNNVATRSTRVILTTPTGPYSSGLRTST